MKTLIFETELLNRIRHKVYYFCITLMVLSGVGGYVNAQTWTIGSGTSSNATSGITPFSTLYHDAKIQYVYLASELNAAGATAGLINQFGFDWATSGGQAAQNVNVKMANTTVTNISALQNPTWTDVLSSASISPTVGAAGTAYNLWTLSTPFNWDGTSNIIVQVCFDNSSFTSNWGVRVTNFTSGTSYTYGFYADGNAGCSMTSGTAPSASNRRNRPNARFVRVACAEPTGLESSVLSSSEASLSWVASSSSPNNGYEIYYSTASTSPNAGTTATTTTAAGVTTKNLSGLTSNTTYYFWVRSNCNGTDKSNWAGSGTFTTPCAAATIPWTEGFETGYTNNTAVGGCWNQSSISGLQSWTANSSLTTYNRTPNSGSFNAFLQYSNEDWLFYPVQLTGNVNYTFSVYARQDGSTSADANITLAYGSSAAAASMTTITGPSGIVNGNYQQITGTFTPASSGIYYMGIKGFMNGIPWYISLDDISLTVSPACASQPSALTATDITSSSATLTWTESSPTPSTGYEYYLSTNSTAPTSGTTATGSTAANVTSASVVLSPNTTYYFWVRSVCGADKSAWAGSTTFSNQCSAKYWYGSGSLYPGASSTSTNFNLSSNWSSSSTSFVATGTPSSCDDVYFLTGNGSALLSSSATLNSLTMSHSGNGNVFTLNAQSFTLTVNNSSSIEVTAGNLYTDLRLNPGTGTMIFNGNFVSGGPDYYAIPYYSTTGTGTIVYRGNVTYNAGTFLYTSYQPNKIVFDGSSAQTLTANDLDILMPTLQIGGYSSNSPTVTIAGSWVNVVRPNVVDIYSTLVLPASSGVNAYGILRNTVGGSINAYAGSTLKLGGLNLGGNTSLGANNFPQNYSTITLAPTSTVEYYGGNQTVYATPTYGNLTISTTGTKTAGAGLNVDGTVTINTPATFDASTFTHNVAGSWVNNGTFTQGTSTVIFDGSSTSLISGTNTFNNLTVGTAGGSSALLVSLQNNTTVNATLNMVKGNMSLGGNTLTVGSSSSSTGSITNGSANSFIIAYDNGSGSIGKVKRFVASTANTSYVFPIGGIDQAGSSFVYTPLTYTHASGTAASTANIQVYTKATKIPQLNAGITNFLKRYWDVEPSGITSPNYNITYTYQTADVQGDQGQFAPIKYSSPDWYRPTNTTFTTGTAQGTASSPSANTLTWSDLTTFSQFSAAGDQASALPVELISFQANCLESNTVEVTWSTASEHNSNYFRVDKSRNGTEWDVLGTIGAAGNSTYLIDYALTDYFPNPGINYYRLFQYDMDGTFTTYDIQAAVCKEQQAGTTLSTHPNPSARDFNVDLLTDEMEGNGTLVMSDAKGSVVYKMEVNVVNGTNNFLIQNFEGQSGMYYITVKVADKAVTTKHSIR